MVQDYCHSTHEGTVPLSLPPRTELSMSSCSVPDTGIMITRAHSPLTTLQYGQQQGDEETKILVGVQMHYPCDQKV